jgi:hypothetical protein
MSFNICMFTFFLYAVLPGMQYSCRELINKHHHHIRRSSIDEGQVTDQNDSQKYNSYNPDSDSEKRKKKLFQNESKLFENNRSSFRDEKYRSNDWQYSAKKVVPEDRNWWQ